MHLAYGRSQPAVRDMLREYEKDVKLTIKMREALNHHGECPHETQHNSKYAITDDEGTELELQ